MLIHNTGIEDDRLIGATSPSCAAIALQDMSDGTTYFPAVLALPAGSTVELRFLGLRLVCGGVSAGVGPGSQVALTLVFETSGPVGILVAIPNPP